MVEQGIPEHIRSDNGPEFVAKELRKWLADIGTKTLYIEPGSSVGERLLRELQLEAARRVSEWRDLLLAEGGAGAGGTLAVHYNTVRPHSSLGYRPPAPADWQIGTNTGHGKVESKERFPLPHTPDCDGIVT